MLYFYLKALHIIFIVTWFAGLFYIVRLFIYFIEAEKKSEEERRVLQNQYKIMQRRLWYGISWPSAVITLGLGLALLYQYGNNIPLWLVIKLAFLVGLYVYHFLCGKIYNDLRKGRLRRYTSTKLRLWNEVATLFLFSIVFLAILKDNIDAKWALIGLGVLALIILLATFIYKKLRNEESPPAEPRTESEPQPEPDPGIGADPES